ncbi:hypothetical protein GTP45_05845 [Pseudoduganella sp. FT55W]|uniref:Uncharacterized protein n=2 Tax=Duganella rivi TaxID=2666083 RepID=A0A7X4GMQ8_9BURK|nr:hypothetical protein [Duganella rivi]MYM66357.1 hypothetical protein [Duganella rivi]
MAAIGARRPVESKRILAQLEHGVRAQVHPARAAGWTIDGWTIGLFALLLLMCGVAWLMHDQAITPKTFRSGYSSSTTTVVRRAPQVTMSEPPAEQAAAIINVASPIKANDASSVPSTAGAGVAARASAPPSPARTLAAQHKPAAPSTRMATAAVPTTPAGNTVPAAQAGDTDVTLLTALVAHTNKPASVTPERSRDVVERQDGDTTVQLLARCKQLGLIEGMLCRSRICSGRWEADAACRAPNH